VRNGVARFDLSAVGARFVQTWERGRSARVAPRLATTPGRLRFLSVALVAGLAAMWAVGVIALTTVHGDAHEVGLEDAPLLVDAEELYVALADADATASRAFLEAGQPSAATRARYRDDLTTAARRLSSIASRPGAPRAARQAARTIAEELTVYAGRVEAARTNNQQGFPVGAAYLRDASRRMREEILPQATRMYEDISRRLAASYRSAASQRHTVTVIVAGALLTAALAGTQVYVWRRSHRVLNPALAVATLLVLVIGVTATARVLSTQRELARAHDTGSDALQLLSTGRILTMRAATASSLAVIGRQPTDVAARTADIVGGRDGAGGLLAEVGRLTHASGSARALDVLTSDQRDFRAALASVHNRLVARHYDEAVERALGEQSATADRLDARFVDEITSAHDRFSAAASSARDGYTGVLIAITLAAVLGIALAFVGLHRRIVEYR
jgi:hypothetical protein